MARGRRPIAAEIKEATGAFRKDPQRRNKAAPKANGQSPQIPNWFGDVEAQKWNELSVDLKTNGVLSSDTREVLVAYCTTYAKWIEAREKVANTGLAIEGFDKDGNRTITRNAYVSEMNKFREQLNKLLPELGLTPASRQKLTSLKLDDKKEDPFAKIMARMGRG
jgi:P27 family predicted phage terminase small subunit